METSVNNKCKAFTSLEQSRKLAEILPVESADGFYEAQHYGNGWKDILFVGNEWASPEVVIPAWSLAALLDQLDDIVVDEDGDAYKLEIIKEGVQYYLVYEGILDAACYETSLFDDLIDACVEMIYQLKERDLI